MKKLFYFLSVFFIIFLLLDFCFRPLVIINPPPALHDLQNSLQDLEKTPTQIDEYNEKINKINGIRYESMQSSANGFKLDGKMVFEKNKKFRMQVNSAFGLESDIGSDEQQFWFWSKRLTPCALYYAAHEDIASTRLKPSFNPRWLQNLAGISELKGKVLLKPNGEIFIEDEIDGFKKITIFDPKLQAPLTHYLYDKNGLALAVVEIKEFHLVQNIQVPKRVRLTWIKEKTVMEWLMATPELNPTTISTHWQMPNLNPKINLKDYY